MVNIFNRLLPKDVYAKLRRVFVFAPDDPNKMWQQVPQKYTEGLNVERIQVFFFDYFTLTSFSTLSA